MRVHVLCRCLLPMNLRHSNFEIRHSTFLNRLIQMANGEWRMPNADCPGSRSQCMCKSRWKLPMNLPLRSSRRQEAHSRGFWLWLFSHAGLGPTVLRFGQTDKAEMEAHFADVARARISDCNGCRCAWVSVAQNRGSASRVQTKGATIRSRHDPGLSAASPLNAIKSSSRNESKPWQP